MPLTPQQPFPKSRGDTVRSADWNDAITEVQRLDTAKVNKTGDTIGGGLTVNGPFVASGPATCNTGLTVNNVLTIPDNSLQGAKLVNGSVPATKVADNSLPGTKLQDGTLPATKIPDNTLPGAKLQDNSLPATKIPDNSLPGAKLQDNTLPGAKLQDNSLPASKIPDNTLPGAKLQDNSLPGAKLQANSLPGSKIVDNTVNMSKLVFLEGAMSFSLSASPQGGFGLALNSFPPGTPIPRTLRSARITNITFPPGFTPPPTIVTDLKFEHRYQTPSSNNLQGAIVEIISWTNPLSVTITVTVALYGLT